MIVALDDVASFKAASGAGWSLSYLNSQVRSQLSKQYSISSLSAPRFGQQSLALRVSGRSGNFRYTGALIALRVNRCDAIVFCLGLSGSFSPPSAYPVARTAAKSLAKGRR